MSFVAIMEINGEGRVTGFHPADTENAAQAHVDEHGGVVAAQRPAAPVQDWKVVDGALTIDPVVIPVTKRPLKKWSFRFALRNHTALVEQIIAGVPDPVQEAAIKAKWDHGDTFHFDHADTQMMLAAILSVDATFDADAIWAAGEAAEYGT
jgi:hypothetical protein